MAKITIKNNKIYPLLAGHPWVFSGALLNIDDSINPQIVALHNENGDFIAYGCYKANNSICFRVISFDKLEIDVNEFNKNYILQEKFFYNRLIKLYEIKKSFISSNTNGFRLVNADADYLPGLIVDVYNDIAVFQISLFVMEQFIEAIVESLKKLGYKCIIEKSDSQSRKIEGLSLKDTKIHFGHKQDSYEFLENGIKMLSNPFGGQKSGFFLDQRKARHWIYNNAKNKSVLNLYSYSGGFSISSLLGGAKRVVSVDVSSLAIDMCEKIISLNDNNILNLQLKHISVVENVIDYIKKPLENVDIIVCDPPAFAKKRDSLKNAINAYTTINQKCLEKLSSGGILITSSCSGLIKMEDFINILKKVALHTHKPIRILEIFTEDVDHTKLLGFKEGEYLKTLILQVI